MKATTIIAAAMAASVLTGCGTTPAGIVISPAGQYGTMILGPGKKRRYPHQGVDYRKPKGSPVMAAADGTVTKATHSPMPQGGWNRFDCRNEVHIEHTGIAEGFNTVYCHLGKVHVHYGDTVRRGQIIGTIGTCASGPHVCSYHLHFEVTQPKQFVRYDPQTKVAGCYGREDVTPTRDRPLTYPVKC